jgi:Rad3-related DNA helicase
VQKGSNESIFTRINTKKQIFIEPSNKNEFSTMMPRYYAEVTRGGACFFAVCRGKASEGIDFSDDRAR